MTLTKAADRAKERITDELKRYVAARQAENEAEPGKRPPVIKSGQWWTTYCGDVVRIDSVTWQAVRGTRWRSFHGRRICAGICSYGTRGHAIGVVYITNDDLARQIAKPEWAEELEQVQ